MLRLHYARFPWHPVCDLVKTLVVTALAVAWMVATGLKLFGLFACVISVVYIAAILIVRPCQRLGTQSDCWTAHDYVDFLQVVVIFTICVFWLTQARDFLPSIGALISAVYLVWKVMKPLPRSQSLPHREA